MLGGNGVSFPGAPANNAEVYNNTIVGMQDWTAIILINGGTGNIARNNIWSGLGPGVASGATANTTGFIGYALAGATAELAAAST